MRQAIRHFSTVPGNEIIFSRREQMLVVRPRRADKGNAAGERFERPNRRNSNQAFRIRPARHMHRYLELRKDVRNEKIRQPSLVANPRIGQAGLGRLWIANAIDSRFQLQIADRFQQELV